MIRPTDVNGIETFWFLHVGPQYGTVCKEVGLKYIVDLYSA